VALLLHQGLCQKVHAVSLSWILASYVTILHHRKIFLFRITWVLIYADSGHPLPDFEHSDIRCISYSITLYVASLGYYLAVNNGLICFVSAFFRILYWLHCCLLCLSPLSASLCRIRRLLLWLQASNIIVMKMIIRDILVFGLWSYVFCLIFLYIIALFSIHNLFYCWGFCLECLDLSSSCPFLFCLLCINLLLLSSPVILLSPDKFSLAEQYVIFADHIIFKM